MLYRKQCKRYDVEGDAHCLTFSCFHRLPLFSKTRSCQWMRDALQLGREIRRYDLWAYVIMPEHVHVVLWPHPGVMISQILTTIKQSVAKRALLWLRESAPDFLLRLEDHQGDGRVVHRFWQRGGGYDRNLRSATDIHEKIEYAHNNPVRRGLVIRAADWHWSSCRAWEMTCNEPIAIDRHSVPVVMPRE
jgi:putative transposase